MEYVSPVLEPPKYAIKDILGLLHDHWIKVEIGRLNQLFQLTRQLLSDRLDTFGGRFFPLGTDSPCLSQPLYGPSDEMKRDIRFLE